ncbi:hypothetical protein QTP70_012488 [Hemibagrus guttatus]|uniref:Uncharacterized protein n=1 Tax=Hemibagrus guttatus TaxID=175788 RepID=A0AAE0URN3_9TELE|nr:hypothetical protein QTP70_012488 [Hemibagrus guttatus]
MPQERAERSGSERLGFVIIDVVIIIIIIIIILILIIIIILILILIITRARVTGKENRKKTQCTRKDEDQLLSAVGSGDVRKVRNILAREETPRNLLRADASGWTALHEASYYGRAQCLKLLLTAVPEMIDTRTRKHQTPLILAVSREHLHCVESLLEKGADPGIPTVTNETPLYEGVSTANHLSPPIPIFCILNTCTH